MLRCVFVGSPNRFTRLIVHWLSNHAHLAGVVWTSSAYWAHSHSGRVRFAKKRLSRFGVLKTVDEALYYFLSKKVLNHTEEQFQIRLVDAYVREYGLPEWEGDSIRTDDINSKDVVSFVRERSPDLIMAMCINEFFRREIRQTPRNAQNGECSPLYSGTIPSCQRNAPRRRGGRGFESPLVHQISKDLHYF